MDQESNKSINRGFIRAILLVLVIIVLLAVFGVDLGPIGHYALKALELIWQIITLILSFFIEFLKAALDILRFMVK